ncbi:hypothetical protein JVU11DRAFT_3992 [Chiua virens]|nr:hypothetical protein JVU11DRAFT_3992 [Chiua virens]
MAIDVLGPRDVQTTLNQYHSTESPGQLPYFYVGPPPEGVPRHNSKVEPHPVVIHDARGKQEGFGLEITGFEWKTYPSGEKTFYDEERIKKVYYPEVEKLLMEHVGAKKVIIFDHTVRRKPLPGEDEKERGPLHFAHCDQTPEAAKHRVEALCPDEAEKLLKGRYQVINVWRPIDNPVAHNPLALADFRTLNVDTDLIQMKLIMANGLEIMLYGIKNNPSQKWYYLSDQTPDEVTIFKCFDSDFSKPWVTPHSAFPDKTSPPDAPARQSIEVRAMIFYAD